MLAVALAHRLADDRNPIAGIGLGSLIVSATSLRMLRSVRHGFAEPGQPGCKGVLNRLRIRRWELVFEWQSPVGPPGKSLRFVELLKLRDELLPKPIRRIGRRGWWWRGPFW